MFYKTFFDGLERGGLSLPVSRILLSLFQPAGFPREPRVERLSVFLEDREADSGWIWRREAAGCQ